MRGLKKVIAGIGFLISGSIGCAIGNLEQTTYYTNAASGYTTVPTYYLFLVFMVIGVAFTVWGILDSHGDN